MVKCKWMITYNSLKIRRDYKDHILSFPKFIPKTYGNSLYEKSNKKRRPYSQKENRILQSVMLKNSLTLFSNHAFPHGLFHSCDFHFRSSIHLMFIVSTFNIIRTSIFQLRFSISLYCNSMCCYSFRNQILTSRLCSFGR